MEQAVEHLSELHTQVQLVKVWFDGGASPNPGRAYGSFEVSSREFTHKTSRQHFGDAFTNNQAEYLSLLAALEWLRENRSQEGVWLDIFTDSLLVAHQLNGRYRVKKPHLRELWERAMELLDPYAGWHIHWHGRRNNVSRFVH